MVQELTSPTGGKQATSPWLTSSRVLYHIRLTSGDMGIDSGVDFTYISNVGASSPPAIQPATHRNRKDSEE